MNGIGATLRAATYFAFLGAVLLPGCHLCNGKVAPEALWGVWGTSSERYRYCTFEIKGTMIVFMNGYGHVDTNRIIRIEKTPEGRSVLYRIHYRDRKRDDFVLSLYYFKTPEGGVIRFKNQKQIAWRKRPPTAGRAS